MNAAQLIGECQAHGVEVLMLDGKIKARGASAALDQYAPILRSHKTELLEYLTNHSDNDEMKGIGTDLTYKSIDLITESEWMVMIHELDQLIDQLCHLAKYSAEAKERMQAVRKKQALCSIPESLRYLRRAVGLAKQGKYWNSNERQGHHGK